MAYHRCLGINFPLLSLYEQAGYAVEVLLNSGLSLELDRALVNRYRHDLEFRTVYVDLDDTLVRDGCVDPTLVGFLYQCFNSGIKLVLLTKHAGPLAPFLEQHRIDSLFDQCIHVEKGADKADVILEKPAILIDDSFAERKAVQNKAGIPTFDLSMLEMLIDHTGPCLTQRRPQVSSR